MEKLISKIEDPLQTKTPNSQQSDSSSTTSYRAVDLDGKEVQFDDAEEYQKFQTLIIKYRSYQTMFQVLKNLEELKHQISEKEKEQNVNAYIEDIDLMKVEAIDSEDSLIKGAPYFISRKSIHISPNGEVHGKLFELADKYLRPSDHDEVRFLKVPIVYNGLEFDRVACEEFKYVKLSHFKSI